MVGSTGALLAEPVASPAVREARRRRLLRMTNEQRAQRAIATIAVALREITELLLDLVPDSGGGSVGPMTATVMVSQNRAVATP